MGVHGLWELLSPVGRRVSVETLAGKTLAIDASIWMVQFMKAMRDEKGEMVRNAHLLGFFRRICKLLFLRTKPVFVFDGGTPALKRRTVIARRRQRENAQAKVRKTAEKLLLNHLKSLRLKELASDIKNQRLNQKSDTKRPKESYRTDSVDNDLGTFNVKDLDEKSAAKFAATEERNLLQAKRLRSHNQEELDEMLAASIAAEENVILAGKEVASAIINTSENESDADEEMILPSYIADVDLAVLAALPQSAQLDILAQLKGKKTEAPLKDLENQKRHGDKDRNKGKGIVFSDTEMVGCSSRPDNLTSRNENQDKIDEMLAASIAAEENAKSLNDASTSFGASIIEEEDGDYDEDEEMILPAMHGEVDPAVLASLPPSMQLDLLVQMRERLIAQNRQRYQKVKKDPAKFSELQIQAYLKTVAFRREIDEVQKAAAGRGVGGVQTSRIASEANREYIFSSSFTGDKQELTSTRIEKNDDSHQKAQGTHPVENFANRIASGNNSSNSSGLVNEPGEAVDESIQTYLDEKGRFRVSRLRAMGMRMTRDLQRNLDLMKEFEKEKTYVNKAATIDTVVSSENPGPLESYGTKLVGKTREMNVDSVGENVQNVHSMDSSIAISFEYDSKNMSPDGEDDIFSGLVGGNSKTIFYADDTAANEQPLDSDSDCDWVEGVIEGKNTIVPGDNKVEWKSPVAEVDNDDGSEVEWEEGDCDGGKNTLFQPYESANKTSRGDLEEESNLQEAIRRSLENIGDGEHKRMSSANEHSNADENKLDQGSVLGDNLTFSGSMDLNDKDALMNNKNSMGGLTLSGKGSTEQNELFESLDGDGKHGNEARNNSQTSHYPGSQSNLCVASISNNLEILNDKPCVQDGCARFEYSISDTNVTIKDNIDMAADEKLLNKHHDKLPFDVNNLLKVDPCSLTGVEKTNDCNESEPLSNTTDNTKSVIHLMESCLKGSSKILDIEPKLAAVDNERTFSGERNNYLVKDAVKGSVDFAAHVDEVDLEEEMRKLGQEYINLESEQRKLERNAESVNSELFTECQELLQMFGLPYIIAPMEAEAQCAFLELAKLVDGVVTDDSDVLLFGARSVYKNIFDDRKYVETYFMEDIEKELGLTREKLIRMALLLGSDYTEGVSGIGIVNAIEVVNAFPEEDGLLKFRHWVESPDLSILGRLNAKGGSTTRKKGSKVEDKINASNHNVEESASDQLTNHPQEQQESLDYNQEIKQTFYEKHRNVSKNWHIPSSFPSETVISAYCSPQVDKSTEPFTWGKPDHLVLRKLCWEKFGWTSQKTDELLLPVLKEYNKRETQLRLEAFYSFNERFAKIRSKRIKKAVKGITGDKLPSELIDDPKSIKSGEGVHVEPGDNDLDNLKGKEDSLEGRKKPKVKQLRKRKNEGDTVDKAPSAIKKITGDPSLAPGTSGVENLQPSTKKEKDQFDGKALTGSRRGRGRGRGQGRGRGLGVKRGREKESLISQSCETSSGSSDTDDHGSRVHVDVSKVPLQVRRSIRSHKPVNYFENIEVEDVNDSPNLHNKTSMCVDTNEGNSSYIHGACGDAATDFSRVKESYIINSPLNENLPTDSLELESLCCMDVGGTSHQGTGNPDIMRNADSSDGYLKMGGGFCLEDSDTHDNDNANDGVNLPMVDDTRDFSHGSVMLDETDQDKNSSDSLFSATEKVDTEMQGGPACKVNKDLNDDLPNANYGQSEVEVLVPENANHNSGSYPGAFRAMPFLRKRRKKN